MFTAKGRIHYEPTRNFRNDDRNKWWMTLELQSFEDISRYYRWFIDKQWYDVDRIKTYKIDYYRPSHPFHISIIRGETPSKNVEEWGKYLKGKSFDIEYSFPRQIINPPKAKGLFWICDVKFEKYTEIREYFGLNSHKDGKYFNGHITIARAFAA